MLYCYSLNKSIAELCSAEAAEDRRRWQGRHSGKMVGKKKGKKGLA